jgi:hypothetical protein
MVSRLELECWSLEEFGQIDDFITTVTSNFHYSHLYLKFSRTKYS